MKTTQQLEQLLENCTPEPWHIGMRPGPIVYGPLGEPVCDCRGLARGEERGNAQLIAQAPDLAREVLRLRAALVKLSDSPDLNLDDLEDSTFAAQAEARAALALARGED